ncbi:hypothetical protein Sjap_015005 [Stephania japonica]|uniref:Rhodanese domain-containing protein n=1 Tax=Stephania japonica TaxID=461633 RepID=A0AAP0IJE1_9MAGN
MVVAMALEVKPIILGKRAFRPSSSVRHAVEWLKWLAVGRTVEKVGVPTSVLVRMAHDLLLARHCYLDVKTPEEFSVGHVVGAVNVPYMLKVVDGNGLTSTIRGGGLSPRSGVGNSDKEGTRARLGHHVKAKTHGPWSDHPEPACPEYMEHVLTDPVMEAVTEPVAKKRNKAVQRIALTTKRVVIYQGCKSRKRSLMVATDLFAIGYTGITDIAGGFTSWIKYGLG